MSNSLFYSQRIIHEPQPSCCCCFARNLFSSSFVFFFVNDVYSITEEKSVKAISHIPVLSLIVEVQSSVLFAQPKRVFSSLFYLGLENTYIFSYALHTCLNKQVVKILKYENILCILRTLFFCAAKQLMFSRSISAHLSWSREYA